MQRECQLCKQQRACRRSAAAAAIDMDTDGNWPLCKLRGQEGVQPCSRGAPPPHGGAAETRSSLLQQAVAGAWQLHVAAMHGVGMLGLLWLPFMLPAWPNWAEPSSAAAVAGCAADR